MSVRAGWFVGAAVVVLLAGCGQVGKKTRTPCQDAAECGGGVCYENECYTACTSQDQC